MNPLPPQLNHLFATNDLPTDEEVAQILGLCSNSEGELQRLDADVERLEEELKARRAERDKVKKDFDSHRAPASVMRRFPTEVLQRIFGMCLHRWPVMIPRRAPLLLGHICSKWRQIALASPELWSSVHLVIPTPVHPPDPNYLHACEVVHAAFEEWMIRSGSSALDLSIVYSHRYFGGPVWEEVFPFLRTLRACSNRWRHLRMTMPSAYLSIAGFEDFVDEDVPLLETFVLNDSHSPMAHQYSIPLLHAASKLHSLSFAELWSVDPLIRWSQLTELKLDHATMSSTAFLDILFQSPNLEACTVTSFGNPNGAVSDPVSTPVTLLKLERFSIRAMTDSETGLCITDVLDNLVLPSLKVLVIENTWVDSEPRSPVFSLKNVLSVSSCELQSLTFKSCNVVPIEIFLDCLHMLPSLVELIIDDTTRGDSDSYFAGMVIFHLTVPSPLEDVSHVLLPNLEKVQFTDYPIIRTDIPLDFLWSRMKEIPTTVYMRRLKSAHIITQRSKARFKPEIDKLELGEQIQVDYEAEYGDNDPCHGRPYTAGEWYY